MNFAIDAALLLATAWTRKTKIKVWRISLGSAIGASYVILMLFPEMSFLFTFGLKFGFSVLMLVASFGYGQLQSFLRNLGAFYLINFVAAGGVLGIHYFLLSSNDVMDGMWFTHSGGLTFTFQASLGFVLIALLLVFWFYYRMTRISQRQKQVAGWIAEVTIYVDAFEFACKGLVDTGNQLYDPLTHLPVMIVEAAAWKAYLPDSWLQRIQRSEVEQIVMEMDSTHFIGQERLRLVPFRGINKTGQFILALKPDRVVICFNGVELTTSKVLVGFDGGQLSSDNAYQAILHPALTET